MVLILNQFNIALNGENFGTKWSGLNIEVVLKWGSTVYKLPRLLCGMQSNSYITKKTHHFLGSLQFIENQIFNSFHAILFSYFSTRFKWRLYWKLLLCDVMWWQRWWGVSILLVLQKIHFMSWTLCAGTRLCRGFSLGRCGQNLFKWVKDLFNT